MRRRIRLTLIFILAFTLAFSTVNVSALSLSELFGLEPDTPVEPIVLFEKTNLYVVDNGLKTEYYKGSAGYDVILRPDKTVLVESQRWTVEYLSGPKWKQIGIPYAVTTEQNGSKVTVTRHYTDYASTEIEVIYQYDENTPTKTEVKINSGEDRVYRIVWNLDGVDQRNITYGENNIQFNGVEDWIVFDWTDAFNQFGDITDYTVEDSANGKKLEIIFNIGLIKQGETLTLDPQIIASYTETSGLVAINANHPSVIVGRYSSMGQTFNATESYILTSAGFYMSKTAAPTGNGFAVLYGIAGVHGTNGEPVGAALATSQPFNIATLTGLEQLINFTFLDGYRMTAGTKYCIAYENPAVGGIAVGIHPNAYANGTGTDPGNWFAYVNGAYTTSAVIDTGFYIRAAPDVIENIELIVDDPIDNATLSWLNVTVFAALGVADIKTVDVQVNTTGDTETFTLRWTQNINTFSELSDPSNIVSLDVAGSARTNINATYDEVSFLFNITGGESGLCDVTVTSTTDADVTDIDVYADAFTYSFFTWDGVIYNLINSAFNQFGIIDYMTQITTYITGLTSLFSASLTNLLAMIVQQFTIITNVFPWFIRWFTRFATRIVAMGGLLVSILNGSHPIMAGLDGIWDLIELSQWTDLIVMLGIFMWLERIARLGRTQGEVTVFINDLQTMMNITGYFMSMFGIVINTIIDRVYGLFDAIT